MKTSLIILVAGGLALPRLGLAESVEDYLKKGVWHYVEGRPNPARAAVERGMELDPENDKLRDLLEIIDKQQQGQQGEQQQQSEAGEQEQDSEQEQQDESDAEEEDESDPSEEEQASEDQQDESETEEEDEDDSESGGQVNEEGMSLEEAQQLLDALKDRDKEAQRRRYRKPFGKLAKDW